jgi:hypothetical protein
MCERHPINSSITFAKVVSGDVGSPVENQQNAKTFDNPAMERKIDSQEDWPSLDVITHHQPDENDVVHKLATGMQRAMYRSKDDKTEVQAEEPDIKVKYIQYNVLT